MACIPPAVASPPADVFPQPTAPAKIAATANAAAAPKLLPSRRFILRLSCDSNIRTKSPVGTRLGIHGHFRSQGQRPPNSKSYANLATLPRHTQTVTELDAATKNPLLFRRFI